jgi:hypothetical protein
MFRTRSHKFIWLAAIAGVVLFSCQKPAGNGTTSSRLVGKWLEVQFGTDDNANGVQDPGEIHNVSAGIVDYLIFNKDSTGYESVTANDSTSKYAFTWKMLSADSLDRNGVGKDSATYLISQITENNLTLTLFTEHGLVWYLYAKQ